MFGSLDVSASALTAHRTRLNVIAQNLANQHTTHDAEGNYQPYRRRIPVLASGDPGRGSTAGVHVRDVMRPPPEPVPSPPPELPSPEPSPFLPPMARRRTTINTTTAPAPMSRPLLGPAAGRTPRGPAGSS